MAQSLAGTGSVHHSVSDVSPRPTMRSDGAQLFPTYSPQTEPLPRLREREREREREKEKVGKGQRKDTKSNNEKKKGEAEHRPTKRGHRMSKKYLKEIHLSISAALN